MRAVHALNRAANSNPVRRFARRAAAVAALAIFVAIAIPVADSARGEGFQTLTEPNFKFTIQIPDDWGVALTPSNDYRISGPPESDAANASIIIQIILKSANPGSSASDQLQRLAPKFAEVPGFRFIRDGSAEIAGTQAPFFLVGYGAENATGNTEPFQHIQVALDHDAHYYLLSYSAPERLFDTYLKVFQHFSATFSFAAAVQP